jgi:hypothetical protein
MSYAICMYRDMLLRGASERVYDDVTYVICLHVYDDVTCHMLYVCIGTCYFAVPASVRFEPDALELCEELVIEVCSKDASSKDTSSKDTRMLWNCVRSSSLRCVWVCVWV